MARERMESCKENMEDRDLKYVGKKGDYTIFKFNWDGTDYTVGLRKRFLDRANIMVNGFRCRHCHWVYADKFLEKEHES